MFEFVRRHTRLLQFVLVVLIFPSFVFFGIEGYSSFFEQGNDTVAEVDGHPITQVEWDEAHRNQIERLRRQMPNVDSSLFDDPQLKRQTLEALVHERVLLAAAYDLNLVTTDARLQRVFASDPQFAVLRNPDGSLNRDALAAQGMSPQMLEQRLRQELSTRQVLQGMSGSVIAPPAVTAAAFDALLQQREVQVLRFEAKDYQAKVEVSDADVQAYYKDPVNAAQFLAPEQASVEYVLLDVEALKKRITVSEEEARKSYEQNTARYTTPQERRASHILVKAERGAPAADRAKAKEKAEALLAQVRKDPDSFAELARENSDDPGSAVSGGDLDFFGRGAMVKPFEDAAFALKPGQISDVVESDFGYHIIKLAQVRGGQSKAFDAVREQIEDDIRTQKAQQRYAEAAVEFSNLVYEQPDSLKPVVDKLGLELHTARNLTRTPAPQADGPLANPKFLEALFSSDATRNKRNTEAIELGASRMVSGRVVQYAPEHTRTLDEVRDEVRARVLAARAAAQARKDGEAKVASLKQAPATPLDVPAIKVSRAQPHELPGPVLDAVLKADAKSLPSFVGVDLGERGYAVVKLLAVLGRDPTAADEQVQAQYAQLWSDAEVRAYLEALKSRFDVELPGVVGTAESPSPASPPGR